MPRAKKKADILDEKQAAEDAAILGFDEEEEEEAERKVLSRRFDVKKTATDDAITNLIKRLASTDIEDLKQLSYLPQKLVDPIAKGMAYYESTLPKVMEECDELYNWYLERCEAAIQACNDNIQAKTPTGEEWIAAPPVKKKVGIGKALWYIVFGKPKVEVSPELLRLKWEERKVKLEKRHAELVEEKAKIDETLKEKSAYFVAWAYNFFLNMRSRGWAEGKNFVEGHMALTESQIVSNQQGEGNSSKNIFKI